MADLIWLLMFSVTALLAAIRKVARIPIWMEPSRFLSRPTIPHRHQRLHRHPAGDGLLNNRG